MIDNDNMPLTNAQVRRVLDILAETGSSAGDFFTSLLDSPDNNECITSGFDKLLREVAQKDSRWTCIVEAWAVREATQRCATEILTLTNKKSGLYFTAKEVTEESICGFSIEGLAAKMQALAPMLWRILQTLLSADPRSNYQKEWTSQQREAKKKRHRQPDDGEIDMGDFGSPAEDDPEAEDDDEQEPRTLIQIVRVVSRIKRHLIIVSCRNKSYVSASCFKARTSVATHFKV